MGELWKVKITENDVMVNRRAVENQNYRKWNDGEWIYHIKVAKENVGREADSDDDTRASARSKLFDISLDMLSNVSKIKIIFVANKLKGKMLLRRKRIMQKKCKSRDDMWQYIKNRCVLFTKWIPWRHSNKRHSVHLMVRTGVIWAMFLCKQALFAQCCGANRIDFVRTSLDSGCISVRQFTFDPYVVRTNSIPSMFRFNKRHHLVHNSIRTHVIRYIFWYERIWFASYVGANITYYANNINFLCRLMRT